MGLGFRGRRGGGGRRRANRARQRRQRQQNRRRNHRRGGFGGRRGRRNIRVVNFSGGIRFQGYKTRLGRGMGFYQGCCNSGGGAGGRVANQESSTVSVNTNTNEAGNGPDAVECDAMAQLICFTPFSLAMFLGGIIMFVVAYEMRLVAYCLMGIGGGFLVMCLLGCYRQCFDEVPGNQDPDVEAQSRAQSHLSVISTTASNYSHAQDSMSMVRVSAAYGDHGPQVAGHPGPGAGAYPMPMEGQYPNYQQQQPPMTGPPPGHGQYHQQQQQPMMAPQAFATTPQTYPGQPTPTYQMRDNYPSNFGQAYGEPQYPQPTEMPQPPPPTYDDVVKRSVAAPPF